MSALRRVITTLTLVCAIASCQSNVPPSGSPSPPPSQAPVGEPLTLWMPFMPGLTGLNVGPFAPLHFVAHRMVNGTLFRPDASLTPIPDLAAGPCDISADGTTVTCTLRAATFHDGSPVTAADVAFSYELANSRQWPLPQVWADALVGIEAVDSRTIRFTLARPYAPFVSIGLSDINVLPRAMIEDAYEEFATASRDASPGPLTAIADRIQEGLGAPQPECDSTLEEAEAALRDIGGAVADRRLFVVLRGQAFDPCLYAEYLHQTLRSAAASIEADGTDAIAAAFLLLPFVVDNSGMIGAGPWRVSESHPETGLVLERHEGYHHGLPATPEVHIRLIRDEAAIDTALADGSLDWRSIPPWIELPAPGQYPSTRTIESIWHGYRAIQYNVRPGRLFADRNLRRAIELCIDKERTIEAATDRAAPIYSPIPPGSWAYQPGLARQRDVDGAIELIEQSGWQMGTDGIYEREGRRLSAEVVVRADFQQPIAFLDRAALQVRDCGIELKTRLVEFRDALRMLGTYPHVAPGTSQPFDAYLGGWSLGFDPDQFSIFHSSQVSTETSGYSDNYIGFSNARVDRLLEEGISTYELDKRREIYRQLQRILAEEQPYYFMWAEADHTILDEDITSLGAPLDFESYNWWWQLEALLNPAE